MDYKSYIASSIHQITFNDNLEVEGKTNMILKDYGAYIYRQRIKQYDDISEYIESLEEDNKSCSIKNMDVDGLDTLGKSLDISFDFTDSDYISKGKSTIYFSPVYDPFFKENPFKLEKREYPIEFDFPSWIQQTYTYTIPESFEITEFPKPLIIRLPDNSIKFIYQVSVIGNKLNVSLSFIIKRSLFLSDEYDHLKQIFQLIIDKQNELVVLNAKK